MIGKFSNNGNNNNNSSSGKNPVNEEDIHLITLPYKEAGSFLRIPPSRVDNGQAIYNEPLRQQDLNKVLVGDLYAEELFWQPYPVNPPFFDLQDMPQGKEHHLFGRLLTVRDEVTIRLRDIRKEYRILKVSEETQKITFQTTNGVTIEYTNSPAGTLFIVAPKHIGTPELPVISEIRPHSYYDFNNPTPNPKYYNSGAKVNSFGSDAPGVPHNIFPNPQP